MQGKESTRGSAAIRYAVDKLSKNTMADILIDLATTAASKQASYATEMEAYILGQLQEWLTPIARSRGDAPVNLTTAAERWRAMERKTAAIIREGSRPCN